MQARQQLWHRKRRVESANMKHKNMGVAPAHVHQDFLAQMKASGSVTCRIRAAWCGLVRTKDDCQNCIDSRILCRPAHTGLDVAPRKSDKDSVTPSLHTVKSEREKAPNFSGACHRRRRNRRRCRSILVLQLGFLKIILKGP